MSLVYLGLGSNLNDRSANLGEAIARLDRRLNITAVSPVYETEPWGDTDQPPFLNICAATATTLRPRDVLHLVKSIERDMGRQPTHRWGPRLIDIDILFYDDLMLEEDGLTIPHPRIAERAFVLAPLADIAPDHRHPRTGDTVRQMLDGVDATGVIHLTDLTGFPKPVRSRSTTLFEWGRRTYVMGIINVTPDSFSGDGLLDDDTLERVAAQARQFVSEGADILDIGGESTRPGSTPVTAAEELARVVPAVRAARAAVGDAVISVDTYRAEVAAAALDAGADWVNDVWGLRMDPAMAGLVAERDCPVVIMHNRSKPKDAVQEERLGGRYVGVHYDDLLGDIRDELSRQVEIALAASIRPEQIILDPGIGFGKTVEQNLELLDGLEALKEIGFPLLIGPSRKSFIGYALDLPPDQRMEGTAAAVAIGIDRGADIVRVHDVGPIVRIARMTDAIVRRK